MRLTHQTQLSLDASYDTSDPGRYYPYRRVVSIISLLQSCRVIYNEAITILYSKNIFVFGEAMYTLHLMSAFYANVLPQRLELIRSVSFELIPQFFDLQTRPLCPIMACSPNLSARDGRETWESDYAQQIREWEELISLLQQKMPALRFLRLKITPIPPRHCCEHTEKNILRPLEALHGIGDFEITMPWPRSRRSVRGEDFGFQIAWNSSVL